MFFQHDLSRFARPAASAAIPLLVLAVTGSGCGGETRPAQTEQHLLAVRTASDAQVEADTHKLMDALLHRTKGQYDEYRAGKRPDPPVVDILIISGGGDWGAFGAGFLKGWGRVPRTNPLARPDFVIVTGVSTGALIAPFAFLGDVASINLVEHLYRNPKPDWVKYRGWLYFLPSNISFAEVPGLEREVDAAFTMETARRIEEAGADGRVLMVNTTNIDDGSPRVFDLVAEARRARQSGNLDRIRNVILASAGIPGAFPFRIIDDGMYVDGGVTGNIIYGGRVSENDTLAPQWQAAYPDIPIPKVRFWVLFNNQFRPPPQVIEPRWPAVITRAMETSTRAATTTAIRHLFSIAENSRLKWHADTEVRVASIPGDWLPPKPGTFVKETMNALADLGEKMGADPNSWKTSSP
jgi:hypothetical protein